MGPALQIFFIIFFNPTDCPHHPSHSLSRHPPSPSEAPARPCSSSTPAPSPGGGGRPPLSLLHAAAKERAVEWSRWHLGGVALSLLAGDQGPPPSLPPPLAPWRPASLSPSLAAPSSSSSGSGLLPAPAPARLPRRPSAAVAASAERTAVERVAAGRSGEAGRSGGSGRRRSSRRPMARMSRPRAHLRRRASLLPHLRFVAAVASGAARASAWRARVLAVLGGVRWTSSSTARGGWRARRGASEARRGAAAATAAPAQTMRSSARRPRLGGAAAASARRRRWRPCVAAGRISAARTNGLRRGGAGRGRTIHPLSR
ncbi:hypothetical protein PVAP13_4NG114857 [Panicum virgatum]|uniref:Uncharacterized protein n=1 Tax=Panicum virgatum TaxID=38727 RepID=A0A8T0T7E4_PANVG|nr:hypothetical protein PVAP13_4NG114857 [Panicum virgatum]